MRWMSANGKPDTLLPHSDQSSQHTSERFQQLMAASLRADCIHDTCFVSASRIKARNGLGRPERALA